MDVNHHAMYGSRNVKGTTMSTQQQQHMRAVNVACFAAPPALSVGDLFGPQIAHAVPLARAVHSGALYAPAHTMTHSHCDGVSGPASVKPTTTAMFLNNMNAMNADSVSCFNQFDERSQGPRAQPWALPSDAGSHYGLNLHSLQQQQQQQHDWQSLISMGAMPTMPYIQTQTPTQRGSSEDNTSSNSSTFGSNPSAAPSALPSGCPFFKMMQLDTHTHSTLPPLPTTPQPPLPPPISPMPKKKKKKNKRRLKELDTDDAVTDSDSEYPLVGVQFAGAIRLTKHFFTAHDTADIHREVATVIFLSALRRIAQHRWLRRECVERNEVTYALTLSEDLPFPEAMNPKPRKAKRGRPPKHKKRRVAETQCEAQSVKAWNAQSGTDKVYKFEVGVVFACSVPLEVRTEMAQCLLVDLNGSSLSMLFAHVVAAEMSVMGDVGAHKMYAVNAEELREYEQYERDEEERKRKKREREQRRRESKKKGKGSD